MILSVKPISHLRRAIPAWGVSLLLASCAIAGRSEKRARMATALPSQTVTPLSAPVRPTETLPPLLAVTETPGSVLACPERAGILRAETVPSSITGSSVEFTAYLPPCYDSDPQIRYPVLFLFHGLGRTPDQWHGLGLEAIADHLIVSGRIAPLLIILPYIPGEESNDAVFLADLLPAVEARSGMGAPARAAEGRFIRVGGGAQHLPRPDRAGGFLYLGGGRSGFGLAAGLF
jgi:hypothetical protein